MLHVVGAGRREIGRRAQSPPRLRRITTDAPCMYGTGTVGVRKRLLFCLCEISISISRAGFHTCSTHPSQAARNPKGTVLRLYIASVCIPTLIGLVSPCCLETQP